MIFRRVIPGIIGMVFLLQFLLVPVLAGVVQIEEDIPLFPAAIRDYAAEEEMESRYEDWEVLDSWALDITRIYSAKTSPEEVCRFYINELEASEGIPEGDPDLFSS